MDLHGRYIEELSVGMSAVYSKTVTEADILMFSAVSGDTNPVHMDQEFASQTLFKGRVAHGMLSASFLSTVFGTKLPGPGAIYLAQNLKFMGPVRIGDTVIARVRVEEIDRDRKNVRFSCLCTVGKKTVIEGDALLRVTARTPQLAQAAE
jgi:3-hydroxybutyryl-CoA dehydratase